jgi:3-oxoacyl-[acyl-carrier protein] reductase
MDLGISGKTAIVAGSSRGLGKSVALALAREGVNVIVNGRQEDVVSTAKEIEDTYKVRALAVMSDVATEDGCKKLVEEAARAFDAVDILVTNAGVPPPGDFQSVSEEDWSSSINLTLLSTTRLIRFALPYMKKNKWGRIVNMVSLSVKQPIENLLLSNSLRAAVVGMAKTLSEEVGPDNILVNNVAPGVFNTDRVKKLVQNLVQKKGESPEKILKDMETKSSLGRLGNTAEFADVVAFLCSERASYMTGSTILVDGGAYKGH